MKLLVVGGDSQIGRQLANVIDPKRHCLASTSRRGGGGIPLDLAAPPSGWKLPEADVALLCAAMTGLKNCVEQPIISHRINVEHSVALARRLGEQGTFVVLLSTSAVFAGDKPFMPEHAATSPLGAYGRQKAEAEQALLESGFPVAAVRLTKVLSGMTPLVRGWLDNLQQGREIAAYRNLLFAPISLRYAIEALLTIAEKCEPGIFHLSGNRDLSYADFARDMARALGYDECRVRPETAPADVNLPRHAALGMESTHARLGLSPQAPESVLEHLLQEHAAA